MRKDKGRSGLAGILTVLAVVVAAFCMAAALGNLEQGHRQEGKKQLEQAIRRSAVACYAAEGIYPPDLEYMKEYYGIQIDESRYTVIYDAFAENLMPDITVLEK